MQVFIFTQCIAAVLFDNADVLHLTRYELCVGCAIQILFSLWVLLHALQTCLLYLNIFQGMYLVLLRKGVYIVECLDIVFWYR